MQGPPSTDLNDRLTKVEYSTTRLEHAVFGVDDSGEEGMLAEVRGTNRKLDRFLLWAVGAAVGFSASAILLGLNLAVPG